MQSAAKSISATRPTLSTNATRNGGDQGYSSDQRTFSVARINISSCKKLVELMIRGEPKLLHHSWVAHRDGQFTVMAAVSHLIDGMEAASQNVEFALSRTEQNPKTQPGNRRRWKTAAS
jgi:hypothetical protein